MREELGVRIAFLFIASALSGAFGGLIALGVLYMDGVNGWSGWRWYVFDLVMNFLLHAANQESKAVRD